MFFFIFIQSSTAITELAIASHAIRNFTVGFIHLAMIGVVNSFLFAFITQTSLYGSKNKLADTGIMIFLLGFTAMEYLLFSEGLNLFIGNGYHTFYYTAILIATVFIGIGLLLFLSGLLNQKTVKL